jgi:hypothetical protein
MHCNTNINFNKTCLEKQLIPKYAEIKIKTVNNNLAAKRTKEKAQLVRIKDEIELLYIQKHKINKNLYSFAYMEQSPS